MSDTPGPYDMLEPERPPAPVPHSVPRPPAPGREPSAMRAFARGATRRCPRCGAGQVFRSWLKIRDRCPRCRLRLEREEGGFLGAMTVNYAVTALVFVVFLVVWLVLDLPEVRVATLTIASVALVAMFPLLFYPFSKTLWATVDYLVYRSSPDYASVDAADRATGNGGRY